MPIKLNGETGGSVSFDAPDNTSPSGTAVTLTLPTSAGSAGQYLRNSSTAGTLEFGSVIQGVSEIDQWYNTADVTTNTTVTSLARNNHEGATKIGTGLSVSSGVFTFPSTGKWLVVAKIDFSINGSDTVNVSTEVTLDNSTYNAVTYAQDGNNGTGARNGSATSLYLLDVTDTSLVKVKFVASSLGSGSTVIGDTAYMPTNFTFIRFGDT